MAEIVKKAIIGTSIKTLKGNVTARVTEGIFVLSSMRRMTLLEFSTIQTNSNRMKMEKMLKGFADNGTPSNAMVIVYEMMHPETGLVFREFDKEPTKDVKGNMEFSPASNFARLSTYGDVAEGMKIFCQTLPRKDGKMFLKITPSVAATLPVED